MISVKIKKPTNDKPNIPFVYYVNEVKKLNVSGEVIDYIVRTHHIETIGQFMDKCIVILNAAEKVFPELKNAETQKYLLGYLSEVAKDFYSED